jgi:hypothetical protein
MLKPLIMRTAVVQASGAVPDGCSEGRSGGGIAAPYQAASDGVARRGPAAAQVQQNY